MNTRYIVVMFDKGIGHTLQMDNKPHVFFKRYALTYKNLACAIKRANKLFHQYINDKVCVFKVVLDERLSCDRYDDWCRDEDRLMWQIKREL